MPVVVFQWVYPRELYRAKARIELRFGEHQGFSQDARLSRVHATIRPKRNLVEIIRPESQSVNS